MENIIPKIKKAIEDDIQPFIAMHGGDIVFQGYEKGILTISLEGACDSCSQSDLTLKIGVESRLKSLFPEIKEVVRIEG